jgi:hypothetical protein
VRLLTLLALVLLGPSACAAALVPPPPEGVGIPVDLPLVSVGSVENPELRELSGLVASRDHEDVLWTHGDSGSPPRLFALGADLQTVVPDWLRARFGTGAGVVRPPWPGIELAGATHVDWEAVARIGDRLYVADVGNNGNARRDLGFWELPEPAPEAVDRARPARFLPVHYPEQRAFPGEVWEWDCEAVFSDGDVLWLITKHRRADEITGFVPGARLYRFEPGRAGEASTPLELVARHGTLSVATGADLSPDGELLAVLTYSALWLFPRPEAGAHWLSGRPWIRRLPLLRTRQAEAVAWRDDRRLLVANEDGAFFEVVVDREVLAAAAP